MSLRTTIASTAVALLATVAASTAVAATPSPSLPKPKGLTGTWSGKTMQELPPLADGDDFVDWQKRIAVQAYGGRLSLLVVSVRYTCADPDNPRAGDILLSLGWSKKKPGPLLGPGGGFSLVVSQIDDPISGRTVRLPLPVHIVGSLGTGAASGRFDMNAAGCAGKGTWQARRRY
jgi:hypothetical protein